MLADGFVDGVDLIERFLDGFGTHDFAIDPDGEENGGEAAVAQYRELRKEYYGRQAYDFGEETLINASAPIATGKPDDAVALLKLNLEFYEISAVTGAGVSELAWAMARYVEEVRRRSTGGEEVTGAVLDETEPETKSNKKTKGRIPMAATKKAATKKAAAKKPVAKKAVKKAVKKVAKKAVKKVAKKAAAKK